MQDGAGRPPGQTPAGPPRRLREQEPVTDVFARYGHRPPDGTPSPPGGRAARRRAMEEQQRAARRAAAQEAASRETALQEAALQDAVTAPQQRVAPTRPAKLDPAAPTRPGPLPSGPTSADAGEQADPSERAERTRRAERIESARRDEPVEGGRARRIDETLTRLTAAHAGLDLAARDDEAPSAPAERVRRRPSGGRLAVGAVAAVVVLTTTFGWAAKSWLGSGIRDVAALDAGSVVDADVQAGDRNVLVVATDSGAAPGAGTPSRSDTVTVVHVPNGAPTVAALSVVALSIPGDLEVDRPPCERFDPATASYTGETVPAEAATRLVSAVEVGGPRCLTRVVQQLTGLAINGYVGTDLAGTAAMVDAMSGVEVCTARPVRDGVLGPVLSEAGPATLDGPRAADFVRAADVESDPSSEYGRVQRQQQVLAGVLDEVLSGAGLLDVGRLAALRPALGSVVTDGVGLDQVLALALSLRRLDAPGVTFAPVPTGTETNGRGNEVLRGSDAAALFAALRGGTPLPEATDTGPRPADMTVQILNASDRSGLAAEVGETLAALGFGIAEPGNAVAPTAQTVIRFSPDQAAAADVLAATVPSATAVPDPGTTGVLQLVLGRSFDDVVRAPAEPVAVSSDVPAGTPPACP